MVAGTLVCILFEFDEAILALRLEDYQVEDYYIGILFAIECTVFAVTSTFVSDLTEWFSNRTIIMISLVGGGITLELVGPSALFNFPK